MEDQAQTIRRDRLFYIVVIYAIEVLWGINGSLGLNGQKHALFALGFGLAATRFCALQARLHGSPLPWSSHWLIFFSFPVSVPLYYLWSNGLRRVPWSLLAILSVLVAGAAAFVATQMMRH